jgi:phytanoyl-CoA dioxygenase PhyH
VATAHTLAKRVVDRHPAALKGNRLFYELQRLRAYRRVRVRPELTERRDLLQQLTETGIALVPEYLPRTQVDEMRAAADETLEAAKGGKLPGKAFTIQPHILVRVARADVLVPATQPFFSDPVIRSVMEAYISPDVASYRRELDYRYGLTHVAQADLFHFDNWRPICKAFLYLTDVTEENAPFVFLQGSHQLGGWRRPHAITYDAWGPSGRFGHFFPQEIRDLQSRFQWPELVCTGPAGTLILADFRGLHRGTPLRAGRRILLNNTFDLMNPEAN